MTKLTKGSNFLVKEDAVLNIILGFAFLSLFAISVTDEIEFARQEKLHFKAMYITILPALLFLLKGFMQGKAIIQINQHGIYHYARLVTNWGHFMRAVIVEGNSVGRVQDDFILLIRYKRGNGIYEHKVSLTNTQSKAEEEIIAAIKFFRDVAATDQ